MGAVNTQPIDLIDNYQREKVVINVDSKSGGPIELLPMISTIMKIND